MELEHLRAMRDELIATRNMLLQNLKAADWATFHQICREISLLTKQIEVQKQAAGVSAPTEV